MSARKRAAAKRAIQAAVEAEVASLRAAVADTAAEIRSLPMNSDLDPFCCGGRRTQHFAFAASIAVEMTSPERRAYFRQRAIEGLLANVPRTIGRAS